MFGADMDWQEVAALGIVGMTAVLLLWSRFRRKKFAFHDGKHCGCSGSSGHKNSIVIEGRRGETPRVTVKMQ